MAWVAGVGPAAAVCDIVPPHVLPALDEPTDQPLVAFRGRIEQEMVFPAPCKNASRGIRVHKALYELRVRIFFPRPA